MHAASPLVAAPLPPSSLTRELQPLIDRGTLAGAVLLAATKDRILLSEAIGYADIATRTPMATENMFWIASMTKPMTSTAFMMLVDEGKVSVDDPVEKFLPEFQGQMVIAEQTDDRLVLKKPDHPILIREILNHTSGLSFTSALETPALDRLSIEHAVRSYAMTALLFEPGSRYSYSNCGTNTVGRLIEVISGTPYEDFMQQRLFTPLGMKETTFRPDEAQVRRLATIYRANEAKTGLEVAPLSQLSHPFNNPKRKPVPGGGLFSIASDCLEFCRMILNGGEYRGKRYLSEAAVREMTRRQTGESLETSYGFGWGVEKESFGHGGAFKTNMTIHPEAGVITIFLVHQANDWAHPEGEKILPLLAETAKQLARVAG